MGHGKNHEFPGLGKQDKDAKGRRGRNDFKRVLRIRGKKSQETRRHRSQDENVAE
jgi:hypothetical protein